MNRKIINKILWVLALIPFLCFYIIPLYITILNAFKGNADIALAPLSIQNLTIDNFVGIFDERGFEILEMYFNSVLVTGTCIVLNLVTAPMAAYFIARSNKKTGNMFYMFFLFALMIPQQITLIPLISLFARLNLIGTYWAIIISSGANIFALMLYTKFLKTIPIELEESAFLDGASRLRTFFSILMPLLKPVTATMVVTVGLATWNDFLTPMLLLGEFRTVTYGLYVSISSDIADYGFVSAFVLIAAAPVVLLFVILQRHYLSGITAGAVKG